MIYKKVMDIVKLEDGKNEHICLLKNLHMNSIIVHSSQ